MQIGDERVTVHGAVLCMHACMIGDTPASNFIGGFKEGVDFALRKCRMCMVTIEDMRPRVLIIIINM